MSTPWHHTPAAQAILATFAHNPPHAVFVERDRTKRGCEMDFEGVVYTGRRVDALTAIHVAAFDAVNDARPWDRAAVGAFLDEAGVQAVVAAALASLDQREAA